MAATTLGLPTILIDFKTQAVTSIARSSRGIGVMILHDENLKDEDSPMYFNVTEADDIPTTGVSDKNVDLIKKGLIGTPQNIHTYLIPPKEYVVEKEVATETEVETTTEVVSTDPDTGDETTNTVETTVTVETTTTVTETKTATVTMASVLREVANMRWNYICAPNGSAQEQEDLATWVKTQREQKNKSFKAVVANQAADSQGVINFTTGNIKVNNPAYTDALDAAGGDAALVNANIPQYTTYTATNYTARIMGVLAGISLDRSATYYQLSEVVSCDAYENIDDNINAGELCLFDEKDGNGVKIARACNSLTTFTSERGADFRYIKIVEAVDLIRDDIRDNFKNNYVGKVNNSYNNKMLLIAAINTYLLELGGTVLDNSSTANNYVEIDYEAQKNFIKALGVDITDRESQYILEYPTGSYVFLRGVIRPLNAMEDLELHFVIE